MMTKAKKDISLPSRTKLSGSVPAWGVNAVAIPNLIKLVQNVNINLNQKFAKKKENREAVVHSQSTDGN